MKHHKRFLANFPLPNHKTSPKYNYCVILCCAVLFKMVEERVGRLYFTIYCFIRINIPLSIPLSSDSATVLLSQSSCNHLLAEDCFKYKNNTLYVRICV